MRLTRIEKVFENKIAKIRVDENTNNPIGHIPFENLHKVYVFKCQDDLLLFYLYTCRGKTKELIKVNNDQFVIEDDLLDGVMQITMQLN